jgi:hypothetical protein
MRPGFGIFNGREKLFLFKNRLSMGRRIMPENQKMAIPENQKPKPHLEVKTFSEDQLYKIKKKNYLKKVLKLLQDRVWLVYYLIFIIFFLGLLALIVIGSKTPPPNKIKQPGMNLIAPATFTLAADVLPLSLG